MICFISVPKTTTFSRVNTLKRSVKRPSHLTPVKIQLN